VDGWEEDPVAVDLRCGEVILVIDGGAAFRASPSLVMLICLPKVAAPEGAAKLLTLQLREGAGRGIPGPGYDMLDILSECTSVLAQLRTALRKCYV